MKTKVICTTQLVENSPQALPLGAACIASAVKNDSRTRDLCDVSLISFVPEDDANVITEKLKTLADLNNSKNGVIICFSVFVWNRNVLEQVAKELRKNKVICIAGGPEVTAAPESFCDFDYVVTGAGEEKVPALIEKIIHSNNQTVYDSSCNFQVSTKMSQLSSPYLDGTLDASKYGGVLWELARGCPFKCSYCYESKGEKSIQRFPMERISAELELFAKQKIPQVFVLDPTYNANKQAALELLKLIAQKTPDTFYYFEARAEFIDNQLAQAFTKIPCALQIGLQSSDENVLRLVNRPFNRKQFLKGIQCLNRAGVVFGLDLIYGLPGDSFKGFMQSIDFAISQYPNNLEIFCLSVLPGTDLADRAKDLKLNYEQRPPYHILSTDRFSKEDLNRAGKIASACSVFYNDGRAVPWFNTICHLLKMSPSHFLEKFAISNAIKTNCNSNHAEIEKMQISFITNLLKEKHMDKFITLVTDIIRINGAISRTQDTGKSEKLTLSYPAEYLDSEYATNLQFFLQNVKPKKNTITTTRKGNQTYFSIAHP